MRTLITKREAAQIAGGYHPEHVMRLVREGQFPQPVKLGSGPTGRVRFDRAEIEDWLEAKFAQREPAAQTVAV